MTENRSPIPAGVRLLIAFLALSPLMQACCVLMRRGFRGYIGRD